MLITLLLLDFTGVAHKWLGWMAKMQFLPAVLALATDWAATSIFP